MTYGAYETIAGVGNISDVTPVPARLADLPFPPSTVARAISPLWGGGEFVFARASAGIRLWGLCVLTPVWDAAQQTFIQNMSEVPSVTLLGRPMYVSMASVALTTGQYGWFMKRGVAPMNCNATVAADTALSYAAVGQGGALAASRQLVGARVVTPSSQTVVRAGVGAAGDNVINFPGGTLGFFVGTTVTGTGVGASAVITQVDPFSIRVSVVNSGAIAGNVTQTATTGAVHYNIVAMSDPVGQGQIT